MPVHVAVYTMNPSLPGVWQLEATPEEDEAEEVRAEIAEWKPDFRTLILALDDDDPERKPKQVGDEAIYALGDVSVFPAQRCVNGPRAHGRCSICGRGA